MAARTTYTDYPYCGGDFSFYPGSAADHGRSDFSSTDERTSDVARFSLLQSVQSGNYYDPRVFSSSPRSFEQIDPTGSVCYPPSFFPVFYPPSPVISLYPVQHPSDLCRKTLSDESQKRLTSLTDKKVFITLRGKAKLQNLPEIIGEVKIEDLIAALKINLENFVGDVVVDIRITGSGANTILFGRPSESDLRDIDMVIYLRYAPMGTEIVYKYLSDMAEVFESTLSTFILDRKFKGHPQAALIIRNHYLSNRKIVNNGQNQWLLIGSGILDLRICVKAHREFTVSGYSHQISLIDKSSFCLYGDRQAAERDFWERRFVLPRPEEVPNCLARALTELNRHDIYSTDDLIIIVDKYLESSNPDCFISILENHLLTTPSPGRAVAHIVSILQAVNSIKREYKGEVLLKGMSMLGRWLKVEDAFPSLEEKMECAIKKMAEIRLLDEALSLLRLFYVVNPEKVSGSLLYLLEKEASLPVINPVNFENLLDLLCRKDSEETRATFIGFVERFKKTGNFQMLSMLSKKSLLLTSFQDKKYSDFYFALIEGLSSTDALNLLQESMQLYLKVKDVFSVKRDRKVSHKSDGRAQ